MVTIAIAGDTMLGRMCADRVGAHGADALVAPAVREVLRSADLVVANLECCVSARGRRWPDPAKPFFFRAPPAAAGALADLGVDVVTLANNHALDYGHTALLDTLDHLADAGVAVVGAGRDVEAARRPARLDVGGTSVTVIGVADHPAAYAAAEERPGTAYADLRRGIPTWLRRQVADAAAHADVVLVTPHWGPNMTTEPVPHVRRAGRDLVEAGATVVAGHSAHVFHGVQWVDDACVLWDAGDFIDDYAVDPRLRNDLGLLWSVELDGAEPTAVEALPLSLELCRTVPARGDDAAWVAERLTEACAPLGTVVHGAAAGRLRCTT